MHSERGAFLLPLNLMSYEQNLTIIEELGYDPELEEIENAYESFSFSLSDFDPNDFEYQQDLALGVFGCSFN